MTSKPWQQLYSWSGVSITRATDLPCLSRLLLTNDIDFVRHMMYRVAVVVSRATITKFSSVTGPAHIRPDSPPPLGSFYVPPTHEECVREASHLCSIFDRYFSHHACYLAIARFWVLWNYATSDSVRAMVEGSYSPHSDEPSTVAYAEEDIRATAALASIRVAIRNSMLNIVHVSGIGTPAHDEGRVQKRVANANPAIVTAAVTMMYASRAVFASESSDVLDCI